MTLVCLTGLIVCLVSIYFLYYLLCMYVLKYCCKWRSFIIYVVENYHICGEWYFYHVSYICGFNIHF